jgi:putative transposase
VAVTWIVEPSSSASSGEQTPIGVDIGEAALATVCHRDERGTPTTPNIWSDESRKVRHLRKTYFTATHRLQRREADRLAEEYGDELWARIDHIIDTVSSEVVSHAQTVENPVLVLEDLQHIRESMDYGKFMNRRLHGWAFAKLHAQITYKAAEHGIPVETVNPAYTSKTCHACVEQGSRPRQGTFTCTNASCWVSEYQADINAALNIADRYDPAGESQPRTCSNSSEKVAGDDSGGDGACLTGPQDTLADTESSTQSDTALRGRGR